MEIFLKAAGICVTAALAGVIIKKDAPAITLLLAAAALTCALIFTADAIGDAVGFISDVAEKAELDAGILSSLLKVAGLCILTRFGADLCEDAGMKAAASGVDIAGSAAAVFMSLPLLRSVCSLIIGLM